MLKRSFGIVAALGMAGTFFSYLGAAPGYENLFRALMMLVCLTVTIISIRARATIREKGHGHGLRRFYDIPLKENCQ